MNSMTKKTWSRRLGQLIDQIENHPHKEEIIKLAQQQLIDDDFERPTHSYIWLNHTSLNFTHIYAQTYSDWAFRLLLHATVRLRAASLGLEPATVARKQGL